MIIQYSPLILPLFLAALICGSIALHALTNRQVSGNGPLFLLMAALMIWIIGSIVENSVIDPESKFLATIIEYPGIVLVPVGWLLFILEYTGHQGNYKRYYWLLFIIPFLILCLVGTNPYHHLYYTAITTIQQNGVVYTVYHFGPFYWITIIYSYLLVLAGFLLLLHSLFRSSEIYRRQMIVLLIASLIPFLCNLMHVAGIGPIQGYDITPFAFLISGSVLYIGSLTFQFMSLAPIAQRLLIKSMKDALIVTDNQNRIVDLNPAARMYFKTSDMQYYGREFGDVFSVPEEMTNTCMQAEQILELQVQGKTRHCESWCRPVLNDNGEQIGNLITIHDADERICATKALDVANQKLKATQDEIAKFTTFLEWQVVRQTEDIRSLSETVLKRNRDIQHLLRQKDLFINQLAHDLRTPLTPLVALIPLCKEKAADPELSEYLTIIGRKVAALKQMAEEVIHFAHLNNQVYITDYGELSLHDLIQEIFDEKKEIAEGRGVHLVNDVPVSLRISLSKLHAPPLFRNLVANAIQYNNPGGVVKISATVHKGWVTIRVSDTGIGISRENLEMIWDEFSTGDPSRNDPLAKGLGLSIVKRIVTLHDGFIVVTSPGPGLGSTFTLTLPLFHEEGEIADEEK